MKKTAAVDTRILFITLNEQHSETCVYLMLSFHV